MADIFLRLAVCWYANPNLGIILRSLSTSEIAQFRTEVSSFAPDIELTIEGNRLERITYGGCDSSLLPDELLGSDLLEYHGCSFALAPNKIQQQAVRAIKSYFELLDRQEALFAS